MFRYVTVNPARVLCNHPINLYFLTRRAAFRPQSTWSTWGQWRLTNTSVSAKRTASSVSLYRPRRGTRFVPADSICHEEWDGQSDFNYTYFVLFLLFSLSQVYLCFQRVAAEILGVKLNKAEIEQSQVSHHATKVFLSTATIYAADFKPHLKCFFCS